MKAVTIIFSAIFIAGVACAGEQHGWRHGNPGSDDRKTTQETYIPT